MLRIRALVVRARTRRYRFHALARPLSEKPLGVHGERRPPLIAPENAPNQVEVLRESLLSLGVYREFVHAPDRITA